MTELTDAQCRNIFQSIRWPEGARCIKCNKWQKKVYKDRRQGLSRYYCPDCKIWFNDFTGTIFEKRRLSLRQWFTAIHLLLEQKETASAIAEKINVNRHTAESICKLILKEETWCRLLLNKIARDSNKTVPALMPLEVAENTLGVSRRTIYRLIDSGALPGVKVGGRWRFRPEDIQRYVTSKLSRYGTEATGEYCYFRPTVLDKYRKDKKKYFLQEESYQGWVGNKRDYQESRNTARRKMTPYIKLFANLHYRRVITPSGHQALAVSHNDYAELPTEEYVYWSGFIIAERRPHI